MKKNKFSWLFLLWTLNSWSQTPSPQTAHNTSEAEKTNETQTEEESKQKVAATTGKIDPVDNYFRTHITSGTSSPRPWGFSYQRFPGALFSDHFLFNSLTVGITKNLQAGTVPLMYLVDGHLLNMNTKLVTSEPRFVGRSRFYFGGGISLFGYRIRHDPVQEKEGSTTSVTTLTIAFYSVVATWVTPREWLSFSTEMTWNTLSASSKTIDEELQKNESPIDSMFDMGLRYSPQWFHTIGFGWVKSQSFDVFTADRLFGIGNSFTWVPSYKYLSSLSLGVHYFPKAKKNYLLFGASF